MREVKREIEVVENMIRILNNCLVLYVRKNELRNIKNTLKDIQLCKKELKKLIAAKNVEVEAEKEPAQNAAAVERN